MPNEKIATVLVATDFSAGSDEALGVAIDIATALGARLQIMHVVDLARDQFPFGAGYYDSDRGGFFGYVERALAPRALRARRAGLACDTIIMEGDARDEIVRRAAEIDADLIVVGTHGRSGLAHALFGSVAERVVQRAGRPVLAVPGADAKAHAKARMSKAQAA